MEATAVLATLPSAALLLSLRLLDTRSRVEPPYTLFRKQQKTKPKAQAEFDLLLQFSISNINEL
jgi:hypothetical protein